MKAVGMILAGGNNYRMRELSNKRAIAAMPVAGSFRAIDFSLSSMSNSGIQKVAVLTQFNSRSLNEHLSSSKWWDFGRKQGGLFVFPPVITQDNDFWYRGTADAIHQNIKFLEECHEPYAVIASGDGIYKLDYNKVMDFHTEKRADITVICKEVSGREDLSRFGVVYADEDDKIVQFEEKPDTAGSSLISCGIYIIRRRLLIDLVNQAVSEGRYDFVKDILIRYKDTKRICAFRHTGYWSNIASVESYYDTNRDFLRKEVRDYFFREYPEVHSKVDDNPPVKYNPGAVVRGSLIASGSIINGSVENSVIFKNVFVSEGCVIRNAIVLGDVYLGTNVYLENCIIESRCTIQPNERIIGSGTIRVVTQFQS